MATTNRLRDMDQSRLWIDENGRIACTIHAGHYLASAVAADPGGIEHRTPLAHWVALGSVGRVSYETYACEVCPQEEKPLSSRARL